jgi:hypothetical protein
MTVIPIDLTGTPWAILACWGEHNHAPPPMTKTPSTFIEIIKNLISQSDRRDLTVGKDYIRFLPDITSCL